MIAQTLSGRQKAALFCIQVGADYSAKILKHLSDQEIEILTVEIAQARKVPTDVGEAVMKEFVEMAMAERYIRAGGIDYARELLEKALGTDRAKDILQRLTSSLRRRPFDSIRQTDPGQLAGFLQNEHPQTIAVVMAHLSADQAAVVMAALPPERQADVVRRVSALERTSPEMLREVERVLERKLSALVAQESSAVVGGLSWAVDVLNNVDRTTERNIMENLNLFDPELANEIAQRMFLFDDIVKLDNRAVQRILREVDMNKDLPLAMKGCKDEVWRKISSNLSTRAAEALKESVEYLGPVRIRDVEEAQTKIVGVIRTLEEKGEIQISRGVNADEYI
ncbi:MAG: fliG [Symbiobacteriaceae bacterium]|jgi:flagellar motor switch protein FliG|nr:fliG [Symbiobacteriaceae bacterium]